MDARTLIKSERVVRVLRELGVSEDFEVYESKLSEFTETNLNQLDAHYSSNKEKVDEEEMLNDLLDNIISRSKEAVLEIIQDEYNATYYGM